MMYIASVFSQLERETTAERIRDNMQELAKTGRWLGGMAPTGYRSRSVEKTTPDGRVRKAYQLVVDPSEIERVKLIYKKFLESDSLTRVETFLIQNRILSKTGKNYTRFTIKNILENPVYMIADQDAYRYFMDSGVELCAKRKEFNGRYGIMAYNKTLQQHGRSNRIREKANWIVAIGRHQGIVPGKGWVEVQKLLNRNRSKAYRKPKSNCALLSGLLRCGKCGSFMRPKLTKRKNADGERIYTYLCELKEKSRGKNCTIRNAYGNELDQAICAEIGRLPEDSAAFFRQMHTCRHAFADRRAGCGTEPDHWLECMKKNEKQISNLVAVLAKTPDSVAGEYIAGQIGKLHEENKCYASRIKKLRSPVETHSLPDEQGENIRNLLRPFSSAFDTMLLEEKREAFRSLIDKVVWDGENVEIYLYGAETPQSEDSK